jgi:hypothetical protein
VLVALATAIAIAALLGAAAIGRWSARNALDPELRALRARVRDLSARLASAERNAAGSGRVGGGAPVPRRQAGEETQEPQPVPGSRTVH